MFKRLRVNTAPKKVGPDLGEISISQLKNHPEFERFGDPKLTLFLMALFLLNLYLSINHLRFLNGD